LLLSILFNMLDLLEISAINCNSLNHSVTSKKNQSLKIHGITSLKSDIILLSDIRLSNKNLLSAADEVKKMFLSNISAPYEFFYNSSKNKRGVGILLKKSLNCSVLDRWDDEDENALLLLVEISGEEFLLGSIYGPNETNRAFFEMLSSKIKEFNCEKTIIAGDWNCLYSNDPVHFNLDCINMQACPNLTNTEKLLELCEFNNCLDPFRYLYPDKRDYSYSPKTHTKKIDLDLIIF
jgi:exonuclease III